MDVSAHPLEEAIATLLAEPEHARPAGEGDVVAGVRPAVVAEPADAGEVAAILAHANGAGLKVLVRGGGTQLGLGFPPSGGDILLSLVRLNRVLEHAPHDMTVTVQAGMPLAALQAALAPAGQWLALDPPLAEAATIGGVIATNVSGPRRLRYGGVRDQIIGVRVALADGTLAKGGGKVVKNVAGYDLPKLYTGALGTLGVIVAATFRLYPLPEASRTVVVTAPDWEPLFALAQNVRASTLEPVILDISGASDQNGCDFAARFETVAEAAEQQAARLLEMAGTLGSATRLLAGDDEATYWDGARAVWASAEPHAEDALTIKASLLPTDIAPWLECLRAVAQERDLRTHWRAHAGHGLVFARLTGAAEHVREAVIALRQAALDRRGSLVALDMPPGLAAALDPWGPSSALELMRRLKAQFDPNATLNPGRFLGGI